jgi:hypothetical protein
MTIGTRDEFSIVHRIEGSETLHNGDTLEIVSVKVEGRRIAVCLRKAQPPGPPPRWIQADFYRSLVGREARIRRGGERVRIEGFDSMRGYTLRLSDGGFDYYYRPDELVLPEAP